MKNSLKSALDQFRLEFAGKIAPEIAAAMARADAELAATGIAGRALSAGQVAPDFILNDARGASVGLRDLLRTGPVVVSFYRGGWCPYCNLELRALQAILPQIVARGAGLVAISPELPDESLSTAERNALAFPVLSDTGLQVARDWGIAFDLAEELRPIYAQLGHALPERNGTAGWVLPIPATFVIASDRVVRLAFVDSDYRNRLEPAAVLAALDSIVRPGVPAL
ncbi:MULTISPECIES: peroxiredoxin-like family protein [Sphingomonadaceae]|jgi:peroxiredoxin|uniref:peroxiredoxin-like family protein n=1 Tax=Sphingomonadales TaxID=204457 RepID=UPI00115A43F9|nr:MULTISPECIES: peroxiredoxin-like family protein [Sphingomonadaceae]QDK31427.1 alkyl hydroperoxide reductase [Sphingomonas sp. IC081]